MSVYLGIIIAIISLLTSVVTIVSFLSRLKWDNERHKVDIDKAKEDINKLGAKVSGIRDELRREQTSIYQKVENIERQVVELSATFEHVLKTLHKIEEKIYRD